jgi:phosphohistidine phosphatase
MKLHLLRHAKTDQKSSSGKDIDRKLLTKGQKQSLEMGKYFNDIGFDPSIILCSSSVRTRETIAQIQKLHTFKSDIIYLENLYLCKKEELLLILCGQINTKDVFIIGHNDGLSDFASYLTDDYIDLKTCDFVTIDFEINTWQEASKGLGKVTNRFHPLV